jgi:hypothetical protein
VRRRFYTFDERPELRERSPFLRAAWPTFMLESPVSNERWHLLYEQFGAEGKSRPAKLDPRELAERQLRRFPAHWAVEIDVAADFGVYVEPNVWMHHSIG